MRLRLLLFKRSLLIILGFIVGECVCMWCIKRREGEVKKKRNHERERTDGSKSNLRAIQRHVTDTHEP